MAAVGFGGKQSTTAWGRRREGELT
uniref:Uncharacterized protein n=1 Tax=Arundo donax TaxID=35708 RepID=A0A0A9ACI6_ARUDO